MNQKGNNLGSSGRIRRVSGSILETIFQQQSLVGYTATQLSTVGKYAYPDIQSGELNSIARLNSMDPSPVGFDALDNLQHIFLQPSGVDFADLGMKLYDILNSNGESICFMIHVDAERTKVCCRGTSFTLALVSFDGTLFGSLDGNAKNFVLRSMGPSVSSSQVDTKSIFGYVIQDQNRCSRITSYSIKDNTGPGVCFRIINKPSNRNKAEYDYEVFGKDMIKIGRISNIWTGLPPQSQHLAHTYGISFPQEMLVKEKGMMMGACIGLYIGRVRELDGKDCRNAWLCIACLLIFFALIVASITFTITWFSI